MRTTAVPLLLGLGPTATPRVAHADMVLDWNEVALRTTAAAFDPPLEARNLAIVHVAVFDAVNAITGGYRPYVTTTPEPGPLALPEAAAAAAAHRVLMRLYPGQRADLDVAYARSLASLDPGRERGAGIALGERVAEEVLARRAGDGAAQAATAASPPPPPSSPPSSSIWATTESTSWVPTPPGLLPALDPGWGKVIPFVLRRGSQFRPAPPPAPGSPEYSRDFIEIKAIGSAGSTTRTQAQTDIARMWIATGPQNWHPIARQVASARHLPLSQTARALALLSLAGADAFIAAWDAKFTWNQWRPVTAIRAAAAVLQAPGDSAWTPLLTTPPFPDYIAGHTTYGGAAERVLERLFGRRPGIALQVRSATGGGVVKSYDTFARISEDVVDARVWGGIHWRTSCVRGRTVGQHVGDFVVDHALLRRRIAGDGLDDRDRTKRDISSVP